MRQLAVAQSNAVVDFFSLRFSPERSEVGGDYP